MTTGHALDAPSACIVLSAGTEGPCPNGMYSHLSGHDFGRLFAGTYVGSAPELTSLISAMKAVRADTACKLPGIDPKSFEDFQNWDTSISEILTEVQEQLAVPLIVIFEEVEVSWPLSVLLHRQNTLPEKGPCLILQAPLHLP